LRLKLIPLAVIVFLAIAVQAFAQNRHAALASLPEADALIYVSPQRILNEAAPRVVDPAELTKMRSGFADMKKAAGIDPSSVEYLVFAVRINKPASDLSFVAPDVMAVIGGDFSSDSLMSLGQLYLQDKVRVEQYGSKAITLIKIDPIVAEAEKNPILKPFTEIGVVPLTANSLAIGNLRYLKSAIDAANGNGRISSASLESLLRDPNALISASGAPLASFAKSFGMLGLENTTRDSHCDTSFGNFYSALTMTATGFSLRGAMNADNPDTARIIQGLLWGLMQQGISAVPDKDAQTMLKALKMTAKESEVVVEADIPDKVVADLLKSATAPKAKTEVTAPKPVPRRPVRKKRTR
jgi:hypothetical protein